MTVSRPKVLLLGLAVVGALLTGCQPATPATDGTTTATTAAADPALAGATDPALAGATDPATGAPAVTVPPATRPPTAKPAVKSTTRKPAVKATTHQPAPKPTTKKPTPKPTTAGAVHPGAFCSPEGATGRTSKGTPMRCTRKAGEDRARWRAA
jgi:outer membrane biosynthesis protein TonB